jgi:exosome complex component CSL4
MSLTKKRSGQFVVPGERLGVIEEFTPTTGTYVENGVIHSKITGRALIDLLNRKVSVYPLVKTATVPKVGSILLGQVSTVQNKLATIRIFKIGKKTLSGFFDGLLHISDASEIYEENMFDVCKAGDIIRVKLISELNGAYHLSTKEKNLGVVYAFCSNCGHMLQLKKRALHCLNCGKNEKRKIASDYGEAHI